MRYFLSSLVDEHTRAYVRDNMRQFNKFKRNMQFVPLDELHFNYKYLGENTNAEVLTEVMEGLAEALSQIPLQKFAHELLPIQFGKKSELVPSALRLLLKKDESLNELNRIIHFTSVAIAGEAIVVRKDPENLLGSIRIAEVRRSTSPSDRKQIASIISGFPDPHPVTIDNITLIGRDVFRNQPVTKIIRKIVLPSYNWAVIVQSTYV